MFKLALFLLLCFSVNTANAQQKKQSRVDSSTYCLLGIDKSFSSKICSESVLSLYQVYLQQNKKIDLRIATQLIDFWLCFVLTLVNHQVGGHGASVRAAGMQATYDFNFIKNKW